MMKNSSFPNKPTKAEFDNMIANYTSKDMQYYYASNGKDKFVEGLTPVVLHAHLKWEGYNPQKIVSKNYGNSNEHDNSYTLAYKELKSGEILLAVILRGTDGVEWLGNMDVWTDSTTPIPRHYSFDQANISIQAEINDYVRDNGLTNKSINLLITGHSRGAAVANLLAVDQNNKKWYQGNVKYVYAYTFATPNNTTGFNADHKNIYNFCFDDDFVPQVPLKTWNYGKNGINYHVSAENLYKSDNGFKSLEDKYIQLSEDNRNASLTATRKVQDLLQAFYKIAPTVDQYYNTEPLLDMKLLGNPRYITLYYYMRNYIAQAAVGADLGSIGLLLFAQSQDKQSDVYDIASFFLDGMNVAYYVNDSHQALTYYYAIVSGKDNFVIDK
jgi:hypothetical protein